MGVETPDSSGRVGPVVVGVDSRTEWGRDGTTGVGVGVGVRVVVTRRPGGSVSAKRERETTRVTEPPVSGQRVRHRSPGNTKTEVVEKGVGGGGTRGGRPSRHVRLGTALL